MLSALRFLKDAVQSTHPRNPTRESAVARLSRKPRILSTNYCKTQITMLEPPVPFTEAKYFEILQVVFDDAALAQSEKKMQYTGSIYYTDLVVLIVADQKNTFYDDQIVKCPKDSKVMQVGTYNYQTKMGWKTVPIIRFVKQQ